MGRILVIVIGALVVVGVITGHISYVAIDEHNPKTHYRYTVRVIGLGSTGEDYAIEKELPYEKKGVITLVSTNDADDVVKRFQ